MTLNKLLIAGVAASMTATLAAPAFAGSADAAPATPDVIPAPAPVVADGDWTGAYGGLSVGFGDVTAGTDAGDGATYGLSLGYDQDFGQWVLGAGIDYENADITLGGNEVDNTARLKLRAGYDLGQGLLYATAGAVRMDVASVGDDTGYFAGVGYEHMITDQVSVGGEVLLNKIDNFAGTGDDLEATTVAAKVNFRF